MIRSVLFLIIFPALIWTNPAGAQDSTIQTGDEAEAMRSYVDGLMHFENEEYQQALDDMLSHTHTQGAPWQLINTDDKRRARLSVLNQLNDLLEIRLETP